MLSGNKDREQATHLIRYLTENSIYCCEKLGTDFNEELAPKLVHGKYTDFKKFFAAIAPEIAWIKQLVDELKALDSATQRIIDRGSPSMKQLMISNSADIEQCMKIIYDQAMRIERFMLEGKLVPADTEGYWFKEMVHSEFEDYSKDSKDFVVTILWNMKCFN